MNIGIMLRAIDEKGGVGVYTRNIVKELLALPGQQRFTLFYRRETNLGLFAPQRADVVERLVSGHNKLFWDQWAIPRACHREGIDVLFHPKFTAPFLAPCPVVMVVHGADWFMPDQYHYYSKADVAYIRTVMPWYFRKCQRVISVSQLTTENFQSALHLPEDKIETIYFGPAGHFGPVDDPGRLGTVRQKYGLPERFIFTLTKLNGHQRKNLGNLLAAYGQYCAATDEPLPLVIGGQDCHKLRQLYQVPADDYGGQILFPGWLDQADLPAIYAQALFFLYPSNLEAFPIPLTEAMACGVPIITSDANGLREIAAEAAMYVPADRPERIAAAMCQLAQDHALRADLRQKGLQRAKLFSWRRCAEQTLTVLMAAAKAGRR